jgi:hypothetical protein
MVITNGLYNGLYDDISVCMVITNGLYSSSERVQSLVVSLVVYMLFSHT